MKALVSSMLDNFDIASDPMVSDSVIGLPLLSYSPWDREKNVVKTEFEFTTYNSQALMKGTLRLNLQQLNGEANYWPCPTVGRGQSLPSNAQAKKNTGSSLYLRWRERERKEF